MATVGWRTGHPLSDQLRAQHASFDYYQLVSLLLRESKRRVRFRADLSAAFPGNEISGLEEKHDGAITVSSPNYSVAGYVGPLPEPYTEWARERASRGDRAMADFLDLFNDRLHALRFDIKARSRPHLGGGAPEDTALGGYLAAFLGLSDAELAASLPLPHRALLALAGLLADRRRSAAAVAAVLTAFLDTAVTIEQMRGAWQAIPEASQSRLGVCNTRLGLDAALGTRAWDQQARIGITLGPLPIERFEALLPGGDLHAELVALVRFLTDRSVDCEVCLRTQPRAAAIATDAGPRLGYGAWLGDTRHSVGEARFLIRAFDGEESA